MGWARFIAASILGCGGKWQSRFATERLGVRGLASYSMTIGGVDWNSHWPDGSRIYLHHDQLLASRHFNVGAGANYAVSDRFDVYSSVLHTLSGRNGHKIDFAANFGVGWTFQPRGTDIPSLHHASDQRR